MAMFNLLKNIGNKAMKMEEHEILWRSGLTTKTDSAAKLFLARLFASLRKETAFQQMKIPTNATGGSVNSQFIDYIIIEQKETNSLLHKTEIISLIPKALDVIPDDDELVQAKATEGVNDNYVVDNKGWFTNKHLRKMFLFFQKYGIEYLVNLILSDEDFSSHLTESDIQHCEHGVEITNDGNIPEFLYDDYQLLKLVLNITGVTDPAAEMKAILGKTRSGHLSLERRTRDTTNSSKKKGKQQGENSAKESHQRHFHVQTIKMKLPRINTLLFHNGKGLESKKEIDLSVAKWKRNIPVDERRLYLNLLQGKN